MHQKEGDKSCGRKLPIECGGEKVEEKRWRRDPWEGAAVYKRDATGPSCAKGRPDGRKRWYCQLPLLWWSWRWQRRWMRDPWHGASRKAMGPRRPGRKPWYCQLPL